MAFTREAVQEFQQACEALAPIIAGFYKALLDEGVPQDHALSLTQAFQSGLLGLAGLAVRPQALPAKP